MDMQKAKEIEFIINRSCLSKKSMSKELADKAVDRALERGLMLYYYKCQFCGSLHMTSKEPNMVFWKWEIV